MGRCGGRSSGGSGGRIFFQGQVGLSIATLIAIGIAVGVGTRLWFGHQLHDGPEPSLDLVQIALSEPVLLAQPPDGPVRIGRGEQVHLAPQEAAHRRTGLEEELRRFRQHRVAQGQDPVQQHVRLVAGRRVEARRRRYAAAELGGRQVRPLPPLPGGGGGPVGRGHQLLDGEQCVEDAPDDRLAVRILPVDVGEEAVDGVATDESLLLVSVVHTESQ